MKKSPIKELKVMLEYKSTGLFIVEPPERIGEISHELLDISHQLSDALGAWIKKYDETLDWDDPRHSPPLSQDMISALNKEGERLTHLVQKELGSKIKVYYSPILH